MRLATIEDAQSLSVLATAVWVDTYLDWGVESRYAEHLLKEFAPEHFVEWIEDPSRVIIVEEYTDDPEGIGLIAFAHAHFGPVCPNDDSIKTELDNLYVLRHFQKKGIGSRLLAEVSRFAEERSGSPAFWLTAYIENKNALQFYERMGLRHEGKAIWCLNDEEEYENELLVCRGVK